MKCFKINNRPYLCASIFYLMCICIFNFSLALGLEIMKFDIIDAYYPLSMSTADMMLNGKLGLWNA